MKVSRILNQRSLINGVKYFVSQVRLWMTDFDKYEMFYDVGVEY